MKSNGCQLTVLMAVRNGGPYLRTAMDSILQQTYGDFRFLIVDDASTDDTREEVCSYSDDRIELLCLERNLGQTAALNVGLRHASTPWIARMDADDYSAPTRLEEQMRALDADSSLKCVGTFAWTFHDDPMIVEGVINTPINHADIKRVVATSPIIHGSIVVERTALLDVGAYNDRYRYTADLDMYDRLLAKYPAANIPKQLLGVRRHDGQGSRTKTATDELIEILFRKSTRDIYSRQETATIRDSLCRSHVDRARHLLRERNPSLATKDLARAFRLSPRAFGGYSFKVFVGGAIGERKRAGLKKFLVQLVHGSRVGVDQP